MRFKNIVSLLLVLCFLSSCAFSGNTDDITDVPTSATVSDTETVTEASSSSEPPAETEPEVTFPNYTKDPPEKWADSVYTEYDRLNVIRKNIYAEIYNSVTSGENIFKFRGVASTSQESVFNAFNAVMLDHPELFYLKGSYIFKKDRDRYGEFLNFVCSIDKGEEVEKKKKELKDAVSEIVFPATFLETDYEKVQYVHNYILMNCSYDYDAADRVLGSAESGKLVFESASTAYGCLVEGKAICTGYAAALQLVLQSLGIPCGRVFGTVGDVGHRWNWVKIDGKYCYIDPTGNDVSYDEQDMGIVLYDYFCIGEERLLMSHELLEEEYKYFIPESTSDDFDPLRRNGLYFETYDFETVRAALNSYYQDTNRIDMRFGSEEVCQQALNDLINNGRFWEIECVGYENVQYLVGGSKAYMCMLLY